MERTLIPAVVTERSLKILPSTPDIEHTTEESG